MHDIDIGATDRFIIDLSPLVATIRTADRGHVDPLLDPVTVEDRIPGRRRGLDEIAAVHSGACRLDRLNQALQLAAHALTEVTAVFRVRAEDFHATKRKHT